MTDLNALHAHVDAAKFVFFDFDGPICRLFSTHPAAHVAARLTRTLTVDAADPDPMVILRRITGSQPGSPLASLADDVLTTEEVEAAKTACPTPHAECLIRDLQKSGHGLAITSNNSPLAIREYFSRHPEVNLFGAHIYGREQGRPLKPDPDCILRALENTGADPSHCMMIGDSATDYQAATAAKVRFIGFARNDHKKARLRSAGAQAVVPALDVVRKVLAQVLSGEGAP